MTKIELRHELCKQDVRKSESLLSEAQSNLENGYKKQAGLVKAAEAALDQARAEMEREYARLKEELKRAEYGLEIDRAYLKNATHDLNRGFAEPEL